MILRFTLGAMLLQCAFAITMSAQSLPSYVPTNGLVGYWPLDASANDISGNAHDFTVYGPVATTDRRGNTSSAYQFDGDNDYMQVNIDQTNAYSLSAWVRIQDATVLNGLFQYKYACIRGGGIAVAGNYGQLGSTAIACGECSVAPCSAWSTDRTDLYNLGSGTWRHIVVTVDGTDKFRYYVDGVLRDTYTNAELITDYDALPFILGKVHDENVYYFDGKIDDAGMWDRALTAAEISALYESLTITTQPSGSSVAGGQQATMTVAAAVSGSASLSYQWQRNDGSGYANITDGADYSGATGATLTIKSAKVSKKGPYRCVVTTANSTANSNGASLMVTCPCNQ
jgi:hypothetical protein